MSGLAYMENGPFTMETDEAVEADLFVLLANGKAKLCGVGQHPIGITLQPKAAGQLVACDTLKAEYRKVTGSKAITAGTALYCADGGKVSDAIFGTQIGLLREAITGDGGKAAALIWGPRAGKDQFLQDGSSTFRIHDHFTSGNVETGNKFSETADKAVWLKSSTDAGPDGADICIVADDGPGGIWQLTCNDANGDQENVQMNGESCKLAIGKRLYYETSIALKDVDKCDFFCGLAISDVDIIGGVTDRVGFQVLSDGDIDCLVEQNDTETLEDTGIDITDCTAIANFTAKKVRLSFLWDGVDTVYFYVDGVLKKTITDNGSTILIPDDEALSPAFVIHTDDAAAAVQTMFCDYLEIIGEV